MTKEINKSNAAKTKDAFKFVRLVKATAYLTVTARRYIIKPLVDKLRDSLDQWEAEDNCVKGLLPYAANIPPELVAPYVSAITHTFVGHMGHSSRFNRRDFYADAAATRILEVFDDTASAAFLDCIRKSELLQQRVRSYAVRWIVYGSSAKLS